MKWADGNRTIQIPKSYNGFMRLLIDEGYALNNMHVLELAVSLGMRRNRRAPAQGELHDAAKVGQFDTDGVISTAIMQRYGALDERERAKIVQEHAIAGLDILMDEFEKSGGVLEVAQLLR